MGIHYSHLIHSRIHDDLNSHLLLHNLSTSQTDCRPIWVIYIENVPSVLRSEVLGIVCPLVYIDTAGPPLEELFQNALVFFLQFSILFIICIEVDYRFARIRIRMMVHTSRYHFI
jgi:hypothetical protein